MFTYIANDPKVNITESLSGFPFQQSTHPFTVKFFTNQIGPTSGGPKNVKMGLSMSAYCSVARAIDVFLKNLPSGVEITKWAALNNLPINPLKAKAAPNAYYNRRELAFYYDKFPEYGWSYTALSPDIVCHETGHALWDSLRPDGWTVQTLEASAYHEAFAECMAVCSAIESAETINAVIAATGGNIMTVNDITYTSEELGYILQTFYDEAPYANNDFWGSMINSYNYVDPSTLPGNGNYDELLKEPHSFARIWTGAWYEMMGYLYSSMSGSSVEKWQSARDLLLSTQIRAMKDVAFTPTLYSALANEILTASETTEFGNGAYTSAYESIFASRNIATTSRRGLRVKRLADYAFDDHHAIRSKTHIKVYERSKKLVRLADYYKGSPKNKLHEILVPVHIQNAYHFDSKGILLRESVSSHETALKAVTDYVDYLHEENLVGNHAKATHQIGKKGVLKRRRICS